MSELDISVIVVPTDFTDRCASALDAAIAVASEDSAIHLVHILSPLPVAEGWADTFENERRAAADKSLGDQVARVGDPRVKVHLVLGGMGNPGNDVADTATRLGSTLIVLPSHGRTGLARWAIGSVAERVVRLAHCPVLVMKGDVTWPPQQVLAPFDFSELSARALQVAGDLAGDAGQLHIGHVMGPMPPKTPEVMRDPELDARRKKHVFTSMREVMAARGVEDAHPHVLLGPTGNAGEQLCELGEQLETDLIVLPSHGRTGLARLLIGSVAERVVRRSTVPVLVLRQ